MTILFAESCAPLAWWCKSCGKVVRVALVGLREMVCTACKEIVGEWVREADLVYPPRH